MKVVKPTRPAPDGFLIEVAELAGFDPNLVVDGTLRIDVETEVVKGKRQTVARVTGQFYKEVDADAVTAIAMKHDRIRAARP